jgi:hypothetical protein
MTGGKRACAATTTESATSASSSVLAWESRGTAAGLGVSRDGEEEDESCNANRSFHSHLPFSTMNNSLLRLQWQLRNQRDG